jgi:hypothetical protein
MNIKLIKCLLFSIFLSFSVGIFSEVITPFQADNSGYPAGQYLVSKYLMTKAAACFDIWRF